MNPLILDLEFTPIVLPLIISLIILLILGFYAFTRQRSVLSTLFAWLMFSLSIWTLCYILGLLSVDLSGKIFWLRLKYIGSIATPILWLVFSLHFTQKNHLLTRGLVRALFTYAIITLLLVATSDLHPWMWKAVTIRPGTYEVDAVFGIYFLVYQIVSYLAIIISAFFYIIYYFSAQKFYRRQALIMIISSLIPFIGALLDDVLGLDIIPQLDESILFFLPSGILFAYALFRLDVLVVLPIAHNLLLHNMSVGMLVLDAEQRLLEINPAAAILLRVDAESMIGKPANPLLKQLHGIDLKKETVAELMVERQGERTACFQVRVDHILIDIDRVGTLLQLSDITEQKNAETALKLIAITDDLTQVHNRRYFFEAAEREFSRARRHGLEFALLMMDLDHFKEVNDRLGHFAGDDVLKQAAQICTGILRREDVFARFGGEEFICLLPNTNCKAALAVAEKIRLTFEGTLFKTNEGDVHLTTSIGLTQFKPDDKTVELRELLERADKALLKAKEAGRNRISTCQ